MEKPDLNQLLAYYFISVAIALKQVSFTESTENNAAFI